MDETKIKNLFELKISWKEHEQNEFCADNIVAIFDEIQATVPPEMKVGDWVKYTGTHTKYIFEITAFTENSTISSLKFMFVMDK